MTPGLYDGDGDITRRLIDDKGRVGSTTLNRGHIKHMPSFKAALEAFITPTYSTVLRMGAPMVRVIHASMRARVRCGGCGGGR